MKNIATVITLLFITLSISVPAAAWLDKVEEKANRGATNFAGFWLEIPYQLVNAFEKAETKFNRGLANMVVFWIEIPYQLFKGVKANPLTGVPLGIGKSLYMIPARIGSGAVDLATFPVPFPIEDYGSLIRPPYNPWITNE